MSKYIGTENMNELELAEWPVHGKVELFLTIDKVSAQGVTVHTYLRDAKDRQVLAVKGPFVLVPGTELGLGSYTVIP